MKKSRIRRIPVRLRYSFIGMLLLGVLLLVVLPVLGAPEISRYSITPRNGTPDDTFLFLVTYKDPENTPPEYVRLVVGEKEYPLSAVHADDDNYTDGKDYILRTKLPEGTHIFYFEAGAGSAKTTSSASTIVIKNETEFTHLDVAYSVLFATFILLIPICIGLYYLRKLALNQRKGKER